jgi:glycosyltransferase involved in cell wall biosynthesis
MINKKVSIITSTHNDALFIERAIFSVINQTQKNWEFIIINDASTDEAEKIILKYAKRDKRMLYFKNKIQLGVVKSLNRGLKLAKGEFIARLDGDDIWLNPRKLQVQTEYMLHNPQAVLVGSWGYRVDANDKILSKLQYPTQDKDIRKYMLFENCFINSAVMFRRKHILRIGGYDETHEFTEDYELWLRAARNNKVYNISKYMVGYRINEKGISRKRYGDQLKTTFLAIKINRHYYPYFTLALTLWYARKLIPRNIREYLSRQVRKFVT